MAAAQQVEPKLPYEGKFWTIVAPLARHYIKKLYGPELARKAYKGGKPLYRELIERACHRSGQPHGQEPLSLLRNLRDVEGLRR